MKGYKGTGAPFCGRFIYLVEYQVEHRWNTDFDQIRAIFMQSVRDRELAKTLFTLVEIRLLHEFVHVLEFDECSSPTVPDVFDLLIDEKRANGSSIVGKIPRGVAYHILLKDLLELVLS